MSHTSFCHGGAIALAILQITFTSVDNKLCYWNLYHSQITQGVKQDGSNSKTSAIFLAYEARVSYSEAIDECNNSNARLVTIDNQDEQDFLTGK